MERQGAAMVHNRVLARAMGPLLGMTVTVGLVSCGTSGGAAVTTPAVDRGAIAPVHEAAIRLPFDEYMLPPNAQAALEAAMQRRVLDCVEQAGFDHLVPVRSTPQPWYTARRYHVLFQEDAHRFGIRSPETPGGPGPVQELLSRMPADRQQAWSAAHERCTVQDRAEVPYYAMLTEVLNRWDGESYARLEADRRTHDLIDEWAACMGAEGYSYPSPAAVFEDEQFFRETEVPSAAEVDVAVAHSRCDQYTDRLGRMLVIEGEHQSEIVSHNHAFFEALSQERDDAAQIALP